jgi:hypothetical protein
MTSPGPLDELMSAEHGLMTRRIAFPHAEAFSGKQGVN